MQSTRGLAGRKEIGSNANGVATVEFVLRAQLHDSADRAFVHSIAGRIVAEPKGTADEDAGRIGASLVQFGSALDHGISTERLGDGISGDISEYWERLFDMETGCLKEETQNEYEVIDMNLLIIDYEVYPKFRGQQIGASTIHRTIDVFGPGCGLIACKPWPLQFTLVVASDQATLKRLEAPNVSKDESVRKLRS